MSTVISIENLSKKYLISHDRAQRYQYKTLQESLIEKGRGLARRLSHPLSWNGATTDTEEFWALKDINLEIKQGDRVGIIGRNGAGKSTLLKILSRITAPTIGKVRIKGRVSSLLEVGTGFHPELTGRENIFLNGAILGMRKAEIHKKFDEIVAFAEVEKFLDTPVKRYSSGMYVRLAFGVAAHLEPEILIVDEVLAVGDAAFQKKCLGKMEEVGKEGRTVLFVSHNMAAVNKLCDRAILIDQGSTRADGTTEAMTELYLKNASSRALGTERLGYQVQEELLSRSGADDTIKISDITVENGNSKEIGPRTGDPLVIRLAYESRRQVSAPAFVVQFFDHLDTEIIRLSTMPISGFNITQLHTHGDVELTIQSLPLVAGQYHLDIGFVRESVEWIIKLDNVVSFQVLPKDVYGSGLVLDRSRGLIVTDHIWRHGRRALACLPSI